MKRFATALITMATLCAPALAENPATPKDAEALVGKVIKALAANKDATLSEVTAKDPKWTHGNLYSWVQDLQTGTVLAHGGVAKLVGKYVLDLQDTDGKSFNRELSETTAAKGKAWVDYRFTDPVTKKVSPKSTYCEKASSSMMVCAGIYKL